MGTKRKCKLTQKEISFLKHLIENRMNQVSSRNIKYGNFSYIHSVEAYSLILKLEKMG